MVDVVLYEPRLTTIKIGAVVASPTTSGSFYSQVTDSVTDGVTKWLKDVTITGVKRPIEKQDYMGADSNGFQNAEFEKKPFDSIKISGTFNMSPVDTNADIVSVLTGNAGTTVGSGKRYQYSSVTARAYGLQFSDGSKIVELGFNNAELSIAGDEEQSSDTGMVSIKFEAEVLPRDFYRWVDAT